MFRTRLSAALTVGVAAVALAACATAGTPTAAPGSPSTDVMPAADKVLSAVKSAADKASAVHVKGHLVEGGSALTLDVQMNKDGSGSGTIGEDNQTFSLIIAHQVDYIQFTKDLISAAGLSPSTPPGSLLLNKWVPSTSKLMAGSDLSDTFKEVSFSAFIPEVFGDLSGDTPKEAGTSTVDGVPVHIYKSSDGTAYVATAAPHYLIRLVEAPSSGNGQVDFTGWDKPVKISPPPAAEIYSGPGS
ncbi:MAG TPA: hypothetical protein VHV74_10090 [Pseudonocardiaceae bacterium]|jgi:hypothetical protein|nr:hypothetical protein [Pseudonocardiaceae bacterium]